MLQFATPNNHAVHHSTQNANHSDGELLLITFASSMVVAHMVLPQAKFTQAHAKVLMVHSH
jgi:hypothetical protein